VYLCHRLLIKRYGLATVRIMPTEQNLAWHIVWLFNTRQRSATHYSTLQRTATHCNALQHTAVHGNTRHHKATHGKALQHIATHGNTLQHTATHCNTLQHTDHHIFNGVVNTGVQRLLDHALGHVHLRHSRRQLLFHYLPPGVAVGCSGLQSVAECFWMMLLVIFISILGVNMIRC